MLAAGVTMGDEVGACPDDVDTAGICLDGGDDCTEELEVAVIGVVGSAKIPFPPAGIYVALTAEVALTLEVALAATVIEPERSAPNSDESRLGRRALKADTSSASSEIESGSTYAGPE